MLTVQENLPYENLKLILIALIISVVSGIIYRSLMLHLFVLLSQIQQVYEVAFSGNQTMDVVSRLNGTENFEQLIEKIKAGTGADYSFYLKFNEEQKTILTKHILDQYARDIDFAKKDVEYYNQYTADIDCILMGIKKEKTIESIKNPKIDLRFKIIKNLSLTFYYIHLLAFVLALIIFGFFSLYSISISHLPQVFSLVVKFAQVFLTWRFTYIVLF